VAREGAPYREVLPLSRSGALNLFQVFDVTDSNGQFDQVGCHGAESIRFQDFSAKLCRVSAELYCYPDTNRKRTDL
jgi:hypothetical protein